MKSVCLGGHFLTLDALHLTAWSRRVEHKVGTFSTNAEHAAVERYLCRLILSMENEKGRICKYSESFDTFTASTVSDIYLRQTQTNFRARPHDFGLSFILPRTLGP